MKVNNSNSKNSENFYSSHKNDFANYKIPHKTKLLSNVISFYFCYYNNGLNFIYIDLPTVSHKILVQSLTAQPKGLLMIHLWHFYLNSILSLNKNKIKKNKPKFTDGTELSISNNTRTQTHTPCHTYTLHMHAEVNSNNNPVTLFRHFFSVFNRITITSRIPNLIYWSLFLLSFSISKFIVQHSIAAFAVSGNHNQPCGCNAISKHTINFEWNRINGEEKKRQTNKQIL